MITQKQLEEVVWLRKNIRLWKERPEAMGKQVALDFVNHYEIALALDERRLGTALKGGAEVEAGKLTEAVLQ